MSAIQDLDFYIDAKGIKCTFIYKNLGFSKTAWSRRVTGKTEWKANEINYLCDLLDIPNEAIPHIFFKKCSQIREQK